MNKLFIGKECEMTGLERTTMASHDTCRPPIAPPLLHPPPPPSPNPGSTDVSGDRPAVRRWRCSAPCGGDLLFLLLLLAPLAYLRAAFLRCLLCLLQQQS